MARRKATQESPASAPETVNGATAAESTAPPAPAAPASSTNGDAPDTTPSLARTTRRSRTQTRRSTVRKPQRSETAAVVEALLRSRGATGATAEDLQRVVSWAQQIQTQAEAIDKESAPRRRTRGAAKLTPRAKAAQERQKQHQDEQLRERRRRLELDQALLSGVVAGTISVDVQKGELLFLQADYMAPHATTLAPVQRVEEVAASEAY